MRGRMEERGTKKVELVYISCLLYHLYPQITTVTSTSPIVQSNMDGQHDPQRLEASSGFKRHSRNASYNNRGNPTHQQQERFCKIYLK